MTHAARIIVAACLVVAVGGCAPRVGPVPDGDNRPKPPGVDAVADAAEESVRDYALALARVARETAEAAPTFQAHADATAYGAEKNKAARDAAFGPAFAVINERLLLDPKTQEKKPYDPAATAAAFRSFAAGCERAIRPGK